MNLIFEPAEQNLIAQHAQPQETDAGRTMLDELGYHMATSRTTPAPPPLYLTIELTDYRSLPQDRPHIEKRTRLARTHARSMASKDPTVHTAVFTDMAERTLSGPDSFGQTTHARAAAWVNRTNNAVSSSNHPTDLTLL